MMWRVVTAAAVCLLLVSSGKAQNLDILTTHGPVHGIHDEELHIRSFLGIPYGAVDRENRFKSPRHPENWTEVLNAHEFTKQCSQMLNDVVIGEEDCLVLNVFAPSEGEGLPVLFHVHGGELQRGSADPDIYGPQRLVPRGIVLVVPNYRLGTLGFLCLRNEMAPGNAGLKDLRLALEWVHANIAEFGGDPYRITVSGEATGGGAAAFLALSQNTNHLMTQLIVESGSPLSPWILDREPVNRAQSLIESLAEESGSEEIDEETFLANLDVNVIVHKAFSRRDYFRVCVESTVNNTDAFLISSPYSSILRHNSSMTAMIGFASGAGMREAAAQTSESMENLEKDYYSLLPTDLTFPSTASRSSAALRIKSQYFGEEPVGIEQRDSYMRYYTDATYLGPALRVARLMAGHAQVYFYEFGYDGALNYAKHALDVQEAGAARGDIAGYIFVHKDEPAILSEDDARMVELLSDLWSSFIINGTPAAPADGNGVDSVSWPPLTSETTHVLNITDTTLQLQEGVHADRLALWDDLYSTNYIDCPNRAVGHFLSVLPLALISWIAIELR